MPMYNITITVEGDVSKTEMRRLIRVMTKALRQDTKERNAQLPKRKPKVESEIK